MEGRDRGNATFTKIPFNEKAIKIAGMIGTQDSSGDLQYTYDIFMERFGPRTHPPRGTIQRHE